MKIVPSAIVALFLAASAVAQTGAPGAGQALFDPSPVISHAISELSAIRELLDEAEASEGRGGWLSRGADDVQDDLDAHLDEIISLIVGETYSKARESLLEADRRINVIEAEMDDLRVARLTAPASEDAMTRLDAALMREFAPGSREAIGKKLDQLERDLADLRQTRSSIERDFVRTMSRDYDIKLMSEQAQAILYQINGRSIVEASVAFSVLQQIEVRLGEIRATLSSRESQQRYYGVAAVMRLIVVRLYERHLADYRETWLPALEEFEIENADLISETEARIADAPNDSRAGSYASNLEIQNQIARVIADYRGLLLARERTVEDRLVSAVDDAAIAVNTLRTLDQAVILFDQFSRQQVEFEALIAIENSDLIPLDNEELQENFLDISRALAGG